MITNLSSSGNLPAAAVTNDIRAIRPPMEIPNYWPWLWWSLAVVGLMVAGLFAWRYWRRRTEQAAVVPPVPPHERARQKLQEALAFINEPRPFCILVSDTVRLYLEERFDFHAPERTTEEFLHELRATNLLLPDQKESLGEFLSVCDMVKFARYEPGRTELQALHDSAVRLVDETEPQPVVSENSATQPVQA